MACYLDLFTRETWDGFRAHGADISGFRETQFKLAERVQPGDSLLCYIVGVSRWAGVLEIVSGPFRDSSPIFLNPDPYTVRFTVKTKIALDLEYAIPIYELWTRLSFTKELPRAV